MTTKRVLGVIAGLMSNDLSETPEKRPDLMACKSPQRPQDRLLSFWTTGFERVRGEYDQFPLDLQLGTEFGVDLSLHPHPILRSFQ